MLRAAEEYQAARRMDWHSSLRYLLQVRYRHCLCAEAAPVSYVHLPSLRQHLCDSIVVVKASPHPGSLPMARYCQH